jgi:hypothetical protein
MLRIRSCTYGVQGHKCVSTAVSVNVSVVSYKALTSTAVPELQWSCVFARCLSTRAVTLSSWMPLPLLLQALRLVHTMVHCSSIGPVFRSAHPLSQQWP